MKQNQSLDSYFNYAFPMQTVLVTCRDEGDKVNIITLAWHTPISRRPRLYGISVAPKRYSHACIERHREFVINFIPYALAKQANYCGTHSGKSVDKVQQTGLSLGKSSVVETPLIVEGYAHLECKLVQTVTIGDHTLFVGEVVGVLADEKAFTKSLLDTEQIQPLYYVGESVYTTLDPEQTIRLTPE